MFHILLLGELIYKYMKCYFLQVIYYLFFYRLE